ncbi:hypothetical protein BJX70DRAFT_240596 [Aspergillus crustosus]
MIELRSMRPWARIRIDMRKCYYVVDLGRPLNLGASQSPRLVKEPTRSGEGHFFVAKRLLRRSVWYLGGASWASQMTSQLMGAKEQKIVTMVNIRATKEGSSDKRLDLRFKYIKAPLEGNLRCVADPLFNHKNAFVDGWRGVVPFSATCGVSRSLSVDAGRVSA